MKNERQRKELTLTQSYVRWGWFVLGVGLLVCSCSKEPVESFAGGDPTSPILPGAGVAATVESRADLSGVVSGTAFPANTTKVFSVVGYSGTAAPTNWASPYIANVAVNSGASSALSFATPQYYPANGNKVYFYAYSPVSGTYTAGSGSTAPTVAWTITGQQDIMAAQVTTGIAKAATGTQSQPAFAFTHKLKQVKFKVVKDASFEDNIKLTSLKIIGAKTAATLSLSTGAVSWGSTTGDLTAYDNATGQTITATATAVGTGGSPVMFEPGTSFKVRAVAGGVTYADVTVALSGTNAGQAGVSQEVTLTFKRQEITASASIASWTDGGNALNVKDAYPYISNGNTIVIQDISGQADLDTYPTHERWTTTPVHAETKWDNNNSGLNVYGKAFEVAKADAISSSTWNNAVTACASYKQSSDDADTWRLPTVRELKLIYDKKSELTSANLPSTSYYWAATGAGSTGSAAWYVYFADGKTGSTNHSYSSGRARCVRDI